MRNRNDLRFIVAVSVAIILLSFFRECKAQSVPLVRVCHDAFVSYYDIEKHNPAMVVYELTAAHFAGNVKPGTRHFKADTKLPRPRVKDGDYKNTGYVRGHLCSAADRDSDKSWLKQTYLTSNLVPMTMVCNSGEWKKVEDACRDHAEGGHVLVIARGPLYNVPRWLTRSGITIAIPDGFFCAAQCRNCRYREFTAVCNTIYGPRTDLSYIPGVYNKDERISVLLANCIGSWSREEYETITR